MDTLAAKIFDVLAERDPILALGVGGLAIVLFISYRVWRARANRRKHEREKERLALEDTLTVLRDYEESVSLTRKWHTAEGEAKLRALYPILEKASVILDKHDIHRPDFFWGQGLSRLDDWIRVVTIVVSRYDNLRVTKRKVKEYFRERYPEEWGLPTTLATKILLLLTLIIPVEWLRGIIFRLRFVSNEFRVKWILRTCLPDIEEIILVPVDEDEAFDRKIRALYPVLERCGLKMPEPDYPKFVKYWKRQEFHRDCVRILKPLLNEIWPDDIEECRFMIENHKYMYSPTPREFGEHD